MSDGPCSKCGKPSQDRWGSLCLDCKIEDLIEEKGLLEGAVERLWEGYVAVATELQEWRMMALGLHLGKIDVDAKAEKATAVLDHYGWVMEDGSIRHGSVVSR